MQTFLPKPYRILSQTSKKQTIPKDYIAIFGDSYAQGAGDWFISTNKWLNEEFHSAHILHNNLKKDVITFGKGGASTIKGLIIDPLHSLQILRQRYKFDDPAQILIYFYEGNDLDDNIIDLKFRNPRYYNFENYGTIEKKSFMTYLDQVSKIKIEKNRFGTFTYKSDILLFLKIFRTAIKNTINNWRKRDRHNSIINHDSVPFFSIINDISNQNNIIVINNEYYLLRSNLQGPALELSSEDLRIAVKVFDYCIEYIKKLFPESEISIVFVPSVLSCYNLVTDVSIQTYFDDSTEIYSKEYFISRNNYINRTIKNIAKNHNINFIDPTNKIRLSNNILHGPEDQSHFNKEGYTLLADYISEKIIDNGNNW